MPEYTLNADAARRVALATRRAERKPRYTQPAAGPANYRGMTRRAIVTVEISAATNGGATAGDGKATVYYLKKGDYAATPKVLGQYVAIPGLLDQVIYNWTTTKITVGTIIRIEWTGGAWEYLGSNC